MSQRMPADPTRVELPLPGPGHARARALVESLRERNARERDSYLRERHRHEAPPAVPHEARLAAQAECDARRERNEAAHDE